MDLGVSRIFNWLFPHNDPQIRKTPPLEMYWYYFPSMGPWICTASNFDWKSHCRNIAVLKPNHTTVLSFLGMATQFQVQQTQWENRYFTNVSLTKFPLSISYLHDTNFLIIILSNWFLQSMRMQVANWTLGLLTAWLLGHGVLVVICVKDFIDQWMLNETHIKFRNWSDKLFTTKMPKLKTVLSIVPKWFVVNLWRLEMILKCIVDD